MKKSAKLRGRLNATHREAIMEIEENVNGFSIPVNMMVPIEQFYMVDEDCCTHIGKDDSERTVAVMTTKEDRSVTIAHGLSALSVVDLVGLLEALEKLDSPTKIPLSVDQMF
jgi:hypothetical protein